MGEIQVMSGRVGQTAGVGPEDCSAGLMQKDDNAQQQGCNGISVHALQRDSRN